MLINIADSALAIGRSTAEKGLCYLKQVKQRSITQTYGEDNVCLCRLHSANGFLRFKFLGNGHESDHIRPPAVIKRQKQVATAQRLASRGLTQRHIAEKLGVSVGVVNKIFKT